MKIVVHPKWWGEKWEKEEEEESIGETPTDATGTVAFPQVFCCANASCWSSCFSIYVPGTA